MTAFWPLAGAMAALALIFIALPVMRKQREEHVDRDQLNTAMIREQLAELKNDMAAGKLDAEAFESARHDLERELLNTVSDDTQAPQKASRSYCCR